LVRQRTLAAGAVAVLAVVILAAVFTAPLAARPRPPPAGSAGVRTDVLTETNLTVGAYPVGVVYDPANKEVYVANSGSNTTSAIASRSHRVVTIPVGQDPHHLLYDPADQGVYVLNVLSHNVSVINGSNRVARTFTLPAGYPGPIALDPANGNVYVFAYNGSVPTLWDLNHTTGTMRGLPLLGVPSGLAYDNATGDLVAAEGSPNDLQLVAPTDAVTRLHLAKGLTPGFALYDPANQDMLVTDLGAPPRGVTATGNVTVLGPSNSIVKTIKVAQAPDLATYDPADQTVFVESQGGGTLRSPNTTVTVLSPNLTIAKTLTLGRTCTSPTYDPKNRDVYVPCLLSNQTFAINSTTLTVAARLTTLGVPMVAVYDPGTSKMMVFNDPVYYSRNLTTHTLGYTIPATNRGVRTLTLGTGGVGGEAWDPTDFGLWVTNVASGTVTVLT
jgi:YVTN family beta-propeller protein